MQTNCSRMMLLPIELIQLLVVVAIGIYVYVVMHFFNYYATIVIIVYTTPEHSNYDYKNQVICAIYD
jgi:hypothetical protein